MSSTFWPKTVEEAVDLLCSFMDKDEEDAIRDMAKEDLTFVHLGFRETIRNQCGLWTGNEELLRSCETKHPDDASMVIVEALWRTLQTGP